MKTAFTLLMSLVAFSLNGQFNLDRTIVDSTFCDFDNSIKIYSFKNWEVYQTENDQWNGQKLTDQCINLIGEYDATWDEIYYGIDLSTLTLDKPFFVRYKMENLTDLYQLDRDQVLMTHAGLINADDFTLDLSNTCINNFCSGATVILGLEDNAEIGMRRSDFNFTLFNDCYVNGCFVTEHTEVNEIKEVFYKITPDINTSIDAPMFLGGIYIEPSWEPPRLINSDIEIPESYNTGSSYDIDLFTLNNQGWVDFWLVINTALGVPSLPNMQYINITPEINSSTPQTINLSIDEYHSLFHQSFVQLRGGFIEGSTTERHTLNVMSSSLEMCVFIVELIYEEGTNFFYQGGTIEFPNPTSCLQFRDNGNLIIGNGQQLNYGSDGIGMLNLRSGGSILFQKNASLYFDGRMLFYPYDQYNGEKEVYIKLPESSSLVFGPGATLDGGADNASLNILMEGGTLDISQLSLEDQDKINVIYPSQSHISHEIYSFPNPVTEAVTIYNSGEHNIYSIAILNMQGAVLARKNNLSQSMEKIQMDIAGLTPAAYILSIKTDQGNIHKKILVTN